MWEFCKPIVFAMLITGFTAYIFEILVPYAAEVERYEKACSDKGGMVYEVRGQPKICIKKSIIIIN